MSGAVGGPTDGSPEPVDPLTELAEAAASLHELFSSYQTAGFTEEQAMRLCIAIMSKPS